jgi:creatinine amidohydrolase
MPETTYLNDFSEYVKNKIVYIPVGTIEWHGNYLPIETDFLIAQKLCQILSKEIPGYILPPFYLGGYGSAVIDGEEMRGMDRKLKKKLVGNIYFLDPELLIKTLNSLIDNLKKQGFNKIVVLTGHGGENHEKALAKIGEDETVLIINPYDNLGVHHADEGEISILWACFPEEEVKACGMAKDNDLINYYGYDPIEKSSLELGQKYLKTMIQLSLEKLNSLIGNKN